MAEVIGDAVIIIGADASDFNRDLAAQTTKGAEKASKSMVSRAGKVLAVGFATAAATVGAAAGTTLGAALHKGFARLNAIDQAESQLGVLLKSTKDVEKAMKAANAAVVGTAFGMGEAATAASSLAAANVPLDSLERTLTLVADSATVGGTSLTEMASIFTKVSADGKVSTEVLNQFGRRGIGATKALADHLGVTQEAVREMVTNGEIDFATFQDAMEKMVGGAAQAAGDTVSGSMANVGAALARLGEAMLKPVFERLPEVFTNLQTAVNNVTAAVKPLAERYGPLLGEVLARISEWLAGVAGKVADLAAEFFGVKNAITDGLGAAQAPLESMSEALGGVFDAASSVVSVLSDGGMSPFFTMFKAALPDIIEFGKQMGGVILSAVEVLSPLLQASSEAFKEVGAALGGALLAALPGVSGALEVLVTNLLPPLVELLLLVIPPVTDVVVRLIELAGALAGNEKILLAVVGVLGTVKLGFWAADMAIKASTLSTKIFTGVTTVVKKVIGTAKWLKFLGEYALYNAKQLAISTGAWIKEKAQIVATKAVAAGKWLAGIATTIASNVKALALSTAGWIKETAVLVAHKTAQLASAVATKAVTVAQKALNLVMKANPIGLVVAAIVLLVGILIKLYKENETVRRVVDAVWGAIKGAVLAVVNWFKDTAVPFLQRAWEAIKDGFTAIKDTAIAVWNAIKDGVQKGVDFIVNLFMNFTGPGLIIKHWDTIKNGIDAAWTWIKDAAGKVFEWLKNLFFNFTGPGLIIKHWDTIKKAFSDAWTWISTVFKRLWDGAKDIVSKPVDLAKKAIDTLLGLGSGIRSLFSKAWTWVSTTFKNLWNGFTSILRSPIDTAKTRIDEILGNIKKAFTTARDGIGNIWDGIKEKLKTPINWVISNVINPFMKAIKPILRAVNLKSLADKLPTMKEFMTGGYTGPGSRDKVAGIVHADEHVWTKDEMRLFPGGHRGMEQFRAAVRAGTFPHLEGYAIGGRVRPVAGSHSGWNGGRYRGSGRWHGGVDYPMPMGSAVRAAANGIVTLVNRWFHSYGHHVRINHDGGWQTLYAHMSRISAFTGQLVKAGQVIGAVGSTGNSTGPHLHFEALLRGAQQNPDNFLRGAKGIPGMSASAEAGREFIDIGAMIKKAVAGFINKKTSGGIFADIVNAIPGRLLDGVIDTAKDLLGLSTGGIVRNDGVAWLGEAGPELVAGKQVGAMRAGSRVYNADETARMMKANTYNVTLNVDMSDVQDLRSLIEFLQNFELEAHRS